MWKRCQGFVAAEAPSRYCPANWMAVAPSPTAKATRLMEPVADVADAYTWGRLISSGSGCRSSGQFDGGLRSRRSRPVTTNPWSSRSITLASQLAWGSAPMRMKGAAVGNVSSVPVLLSRIVSASSRRVSWTAVTWLCGRNGDVGRPGNRPLDPERHQAVACTGLREARP